MKYPLMVAFIFSFLFGFIACNNDDDVTKSPQKPTEELQAPSSLEGTVWVHHPDTDSDINAPIKWFHLMHDSQRCEMDGYEMLKKFHADSIVKISFLKERIVDNIDSVIVMNGWGFCQFYYYSYTKPYISIFMTVKPSSYKEQQALYNNCPLTIDNYKCDSSKCKGSSYDAKPTPCLCVDHYWYLGKVEGDTMRLKQIGKSMLDSEYFISRDVKLIRIK